MLFQQYAQPLTIGLVALLSVFHFYGLGTGGLHAWDECSYALRARYAQRGHVLDQMPHCFDWPGVEQHQASWPESELEGFYSGSHPPLLIWLMALSMKIFGVTTFAARLPTALFGAAAVWLMYFWGRTAFGRAGGIWAAFILAAAHFYQSYARRAQFDCPVMTLTLLCVICGMLYYRRGELRWMLLAGAALGLGLMAKMLVAGFAAIALLLFAGVLWLRGELPLRRIFKDQLLLNLTGLAIALPWHLFMLIKYRAADMPLLDKSNEFFNWFAFYHLLHRATSIDGEVQHGWLYYFGSAWHYFKPTWTALFGVALLWALWRTARRLREALSRRRDFRAEKANAIDWQPEHDLLLALCWFIFVFLLSSGSSMKSKHYMIPMLPPAALIAGGFMGLLWGARLNPWAPRALLFFAAYFFIAYRDQHWDYVADWLRYESPIGEKFRYIGREVSKLLLAAAAIVAISEFLARRLPALRRLTLALALGVIAFWGFHKGVRDTLRGRDLGDDRWLAVDREVQKYDYDRLVFLGNPDQPDYFYYLDGINKNWLPGIEYLNLNPVGFSAIAPLDAGPDDLLILQKYWADEARWGEAEIDRVLEEYQPLKKGGDYWVYRSKDG